MGSLSLEWAGVCSSPETQQELLHYMATLATLHEHFILHAPRPPKNPMLQLMSANRAKGLVLRPNIEVLDVELDGAVAVSSTLLPAASEAVQHLRSTQAGLFASGRAAREAAYVLNLHGKQEEAYLRATEVHVRGINFRVYDPRELYPGEDRLSFTFITKMNPPIFNGAICECFHRTRSPGLINFEQLGEADWYVRKPEIHLRYYLEAWFEQLLSWVKLFLIPSLDWWLHTKNSGYEHYLAKHRHIESSERPEVMQRAFEEIRQNFINEAGRMLSEMIGHTSGEREAEDE